MLHKFSRTEILIGKEALQKLAQSKVEIFGVGGVGSFAVEALARAGIGHLVLVDFDEICLTNLNRQLPALHSTVGRVKVEVLKERILDINPEAEVTIHREFVSPESVDRLLEKDCDYLVDAIDTVTGKLVIIEKAFSLGIPVVSAMGAGNKLDPTKLQIVDISDTRICPLARVMRRELKKKGITSGLKVVYSPEAPRKPNQVKAGCSQHCICPGVEAHCAVKRQIPGSISFVPSVAGLFLAAQVVNDLIKDYIG